VHLASELIGCKISIEELEQTEEQKAEEAELALEREAEIKANQESSEQS